jgi:hypothetical protein
LDKAALWNTGLTRPWISTGKGIFLQVKEYPFLQVREYFGSPSSTHFYRLRNNDTERKRPDGRMQRKFLAALCLHPLAYYTDTWAGSQPPSHEVMAHLMLIRCDEHAFWKKSGQHPITDPRAAI